MTKPKLNPNKPIRGPGGRFISTMKPIDERPRIVYKRPPQKTGAGLGPIPMTPLNSKKSKHLIDDISFAQDFIVCTCAWKGPIDTYQPHRKEAEPSASKRAS